MSDQPTAPDDRVEQFKADLASMKIRAPREKASSRDPMLAWVGGLAMAVGLGVTIVAYFLSHNSTNSLEQNDYQILAIVGLTAAVVGAAVYVRAAVVQFLRFWMARFLLEQREERDGPS